MSDVILLICYTVFLSAVWYGTGYKHSRSSTKDGIPSALHNSHCTPCSVCGGTGMSVIWKFCPECGRVL